LPAQASGLPSFHRPTDQRSCRNAYRKCRRNRQHEVPLEPLSCVIQEFLGSIAALLRDALCYADSILDRIGNRTRCA
jgi:hypothetical protein